MSNPLRELRAKMTARASAASGLRGAFVFGLKERDFKEKIESSVRTIGSVIYVMPPLPVEVNVNVSPIVIDHLELRFRAIESPTTAGQMGAPDVYQMAAELLGLFSNWDPQMEGEVGQVFPDRRPVRDVASAKQEIWDVIFRTEAILPLR